MQFELWLMWQVYGSTCRYPGVIEDHRSQHPFSILFHRTCGEGALGNTSFGVITEEFLTHLPLFSTKKNANKPTRSKRVSGWLVCLFQFGTEKRGAEAVKKILYSFIMFQSGPL